MLTSAGESRTVENRKRKVRELEQYPAFAPVEALVSEIEKTAEASVREEPKRRKPRFRRFF